MFLKKLYNSIFKIKGSEGVIKSSELKEAFLKFQNNEFGKAREVAQPYIKSSDKKLSYEASKIVGLSYFKEKNYQESETIFKEIVKTSTESDDWFNLVTAATLNRDIKLGEEAFKKAEELYKANKKQESLPIPQMIFYYMQSLTDVQEFDRAFGQLEKLTNIYTSLKITDSTFLYMRGVPFLEHTIDVSRKILKHIPQEKVKNWLEAFKISVDEDGQKQLSDLGEQLKLA